MADPKPEVDEVVLLEELEDLSRECLELWQSVIKEGKRGFAEGAGYDERKVKQAIEVSKMVTAYAWGDPKKLVEISGKIKHENAPFNPKDLSDAALEELLNAMDKADSEQQESH